MSHADPTLSQLSQAWAALERARASMRTSEQQVRDLTRQALERVCPASVRATNFIPLTPTTGLVVHRLEMAPPLVDGAAPHWVARGHKVRFRVGNEESVGPHSIEQPLYEALPEAVRALTRQEMLKASREQKLTGMDAALKLTERQCEMFSLLVNNNERLSFSAAPVEGGQRLPSAIWDSSSATQSIWTAMVKRGVLELATGELSSPSSTWRVNPGPRFADAIALVAKYLHGSRPGVPATIQFYEKFGLKPPASPRPR